MRLTHRLVGTRWNTLRHFGAARVPLHLLFTSLEKASFRPPPELNLSGAILPRLGRNFPYRSISRLAWETKIRRYFKPLPVSVDRSIDRSCFGRMGDFFDCRMDLTFGAGFQGGGNGIIGPFSCFDAPTFLGLRVNYKEMGIRGA